MKPSTVFQAFVQRRVNKLKTSPTAAKKGPSDASQPAKSYRTPRLRSVHKATPATIEAPKEYVGSPLAHWFDWSAQAAAARKEPVGAKPQRALRTFSQQQRTAESKPVTESKPVVKVASQQPNIDLDELDALLTSFN